VAQLFVAADICRSHPVVAEPSQFAKPGSHAPRPHVEPEHEAVACGGVGQTLPHDPQLDVVVRSVSQPLLSILSQSSKPEAQVVTTHVPVEHEVAVALGNVQATPHPPQSVSVVNGVSQPSV